MIRMMPSREALGLTFGVFSGMTPKKGDFKACLPDAPTLCFDGWRPACDPINEMRLGRKDPARTGRSGPAYLWVDACGAGRAYAFVLWWVNAVYNNTTNHTIYLEYPGDPPPPSGPGFNPGSWDLKYEIPSLPGLQNVPIGRTSVIAMAIMATLMQEQRKKLSTNQYAVLRNLVGQNTEGKNSIQVLFTKVAPQVLRNNDDPVGCELKYTQSLEESKQYAKALPNTTPPFFGQSTGYCLPEFVMSVNSQGDIYGGCAVHPECRINDYGSIIPVPAPSPKIQWSKLDLSRLSNIQTSPSVRGQITAAQAAQVVKETQSSDTETSAEVTGAQATKEAKQHMSGPMLAAMILAVGAVGIAGYAFLKDRS